MGWASSNRERQKTCFGHFGLPFCISVDERTQALLTKADEKLPATLARWAAAFPQNTIFKAQGIVAAPLLPAMGLDTLDAFYDSSFKSFTSCNLR